MFWHKRQNFPAFLPRFRPILENERIGFAEHCKPKQTLFIPIDIWLRINRYRTLANLDNLARPIGGDGLPNPFHFLGCRAEIDSDG